MKKYITRGASPLLLILLLAVIGYLGCKKEDDPTEEEKLPAATQEGKETFGCLVDGVAWLPKGGGLLKPRLSPTYSWGELAIEAKFYQDSDLISGFGFRTPADTVGIYNLDIPFIYYVKSSTCNGGGTMKRFTGIKSTVEITKCDFSDLNRSIISGTFEFDFISDECPQDTVRVTKGRFDIRL